MATSFNINNNVQINTTDRNERMSLQQSHTTLSTPSQTELQSNCEVDCWQCSICKTTNNLQSTITKYDMKCMQCNNSTYDHISTRIFKSCDYRRHRITIPSYWNCKNCSSQNVMDMAQCDWCETPKTDLKKFDFHQNNKNQNKNPTETETEQKQKINSENSENSEIGGSSSWICALCTFINYDINACLCVMCGTSNPSFSFSNPWRSRARTCYPSRLEQKDDESPSCHYTTINERDNDDAIKSPFDIPPLEIPGLNDDVFDGREGFNSSFGSSNALQILYEDNIDGLQNNEHVLTKENGNKLTYGFCRGFDDFLIMPNITMSQQTKEIVFCFYYGTDDDADDDDDGNEAPVA